MLLDQYSRALDEGGAEGFNRSIRYWEPAYRDSAIVADAMLGTREHDLSEYVEHTGTFAEALDRNPRQLKALITDFNTTAARLRQRAGQPAQRDRRAAADAARRAARARRAQRRVPAAARLRARADAGRPLVRARDRRVDPVRAPAAPPGLRGGAARPGGRPAPDRPRAGQAQPRQRRAGAREPPAGELLERGPPAVVAGQGGGQAVPGAGPGLPGGAQAAARPRRREPLGRRERPVVPRPDGRRHEPRGDRARHLRHHALSAPRRQPAEADEPPAAQRRRAVRDAGDAGPALEAVRPAEAVAGEHHER